MSGIFGYCGRTGDAGAIAAGMAARLVHLPYHATRVVSPAPHVAIGHISAGILNRSPEPVQSADGRIRLLLCGEFYHQAERRSGLIRSGVLSQGADDGALALAVYLESGAGGLARLNGMFIVAVWNDRMGELTIVNDRYGLYPHFFAHAAGAIAFGPELAAILAAPGVRATMDRIAIAQFARFQQLIGDRTWLEGARFLRPGSILRYRPADDRLTVERYWDWSHIVERPNVGLDEAVEELSPLLQRAVDARITPSVRHGIYLTGGLDSRMVLAFGGDRTPMTTITYGAANSRDVLYASRLARLAGTDHHWMPFNDGRWLSEQAAKHVALVSGMNTWTNAHGMHTLDRARELVDVVLSSWRVARWPIRRGDDRGTVTGDVDAVRKAFDLLCHRMSWPGLNEAEASALFGGRGDRTLRWLPFESVRDEMALIEHYPLNRRLNYFRIEQHDLRSTLNLVAFTRSAVDVRCPLVDYEYRDVLHSLPDSLMSYDVRCGILTRRKPRLALVPYDRFDSLPHTSRWIREPHRTWQRGRTWVNRHVAPVFAESATLYADYEHYLRTDLRNWAEGILFDPRTEGRGIFDPDAVRALWARHLSGRELWTIGKIAPLITIEMVIRFLTEDAGPDGWARPVASDKMQGWEERP